MSQESYDGIRYREEKSAPLIFKLLFLGLVVWGVIFMFAFLTGGWSSEGEYRQHRAEREKLAEQAPKVPQGVPAAGGAALSAEEKKRLAEAGKNDFTVRCAACHGADGKGGIGPDLTRTELKYGRTEAALTESIAGGRPGGMPGFGKELSPEQVGGLVQYILSLK